MDEKKDLSTKDSEPVSPQTETPEAHNQYELDTSQGDFTTIAAGIFLALVVYALIPLVTGLRLGDFSPVFVYGGFVALILIFWFIAEKIKHRND